MQKPPVTCLIDEETFARLETEAKRFNMTVDQFIPELLKFWEGIATRAVPILPEDETELILVPPNQKPRLVGSKKKP